MGAGQSGGVEFGGSSMGYQVLRVYPNSPGSRAGLKAYFDFIIAIGNTRFNKENGSLREILKASVDEKLKMVVYNTRTKRAREVEIIPSTSWGGNGLLGVSIKHSSFERADERVWHVVEVEPGSPAQQAGFKAKEDYVIGSDSILQENDDLYNLIETHEGKALKLFVYNVTSDNCREVVCHPNSRWGGRGYLGCEFGHGLLHRIPYANIDETGDKSRDPSMMNNQAANVGGLQQQQNNSLSFQNQLMQHQMQQLQRPTNQPGQQLFQQALFDQKPFQQSQQPPLQQSQQPQFQQPHLQQSQRPLLQQPQPPQFQQPQQPPLQQLQQPQFQQPHLQQSQQPLSQQPQPPQFQQLPLQQPSSLQSQQLQFQQPHLQQSQQPLLQQPQQLQFQQPQQPPLQQLQQPSLQQPQLSQFQQSHLQQPQFQQPQQLSLQQSQEPQFQEPQQPPFQQPQQQQTSDNVSVPPPQLPQTFAQLARVNIENE